MTGRAIPAEFTTGAVSVSLPREGPLGHQRTIQRAVTCEGIGIHTGAEVRVTLRPAPANSGILFRRMDLPAHPAVPAAPQFIEDVHYATTLARNGVRVKTVEHLMAAFAGVGLDNVVVELTGPEVPAMDGSALPFVGLLRRAGLRRILRRRVWGNIRLILGTPGGPAQ